MGSPICIRRTLILPAYTGIYAYQVMPLRSYRCTQTRRRKRAAALLLLCVKDELPGWSIACCCVCVGLPLLARCARWGIDDDLQRNSKTLRFCCSCFNDHGLAVYACKGIN